MRTNLTILIALICGTALQGKEHKNVAGLHPEGMRVLSPNGEYELWNTDDIFVINPRGVDGSFFSDDLKELENSVERTARYAVWNPDSRMIAVCIQTGKYLQDTFVMLRKPHDEWACLRLPYDDPDAQAVPLKWLDSNTLVVEISGSYGGKADHDIHVHTITVRYDPVKNRFTKLSETKPHKKES